MKLSRSYLTAGLILQNYRESPAAVVLTVTFNTSPSLSIICCFVFHCCCFEAGSHWVVYLALELFIFYLSLTNAVITDKATQVHFKGQFMLLQPPEVLFHLLLDSLPCSEKLDYSYIMDIQKKHLIICQVSVI